MEGIADPMRQYRIFEMPSVPNQRPARTRGFAEKVGEVSCSDEPFLLPPLLDTAGELWSTFLKRFVKGT